MPSCPLCPFEDDDEYIVNLHIEEVHFGKDSVFLAAQGETESCCDTPKSFSEGCADDSGSQNDVEHFNAEFAQAYADGKAGDNTYFPCPITDCGEQVLSRDLQEHLDFHLAERLDANEQAEDISSGSTSFFANINTAETIGNGVTFRGRRHASSNDDSSKAGLTRKSERKTAIQGRKRGQRLGVAELGPYAFEQKMPSSLRKLLLDGAKRTKTQRISSSGQLYTTTEIENEVPGIIPVIASLFEDDYNVSEVWLCHRQVQHIFKLPREGGFCGYRNIQMMISFILGTKWQGWDRIAAATSVTAVSGGHDIPNVLQLQDMIEHGWNMGFNSHGRAETGGIKESRKYIGTPEAQALLASFNIPHGTFICTERFYPKDRAKNQHAHEVLFDKVQRYFSSNNLAGCQTSSSNSKTPSSAAGKIHCTNLPPLFLQQPGHSLTIVGIEIRTDGSRRLLVFDPAFKPSAGITKLLNDRTPEAFSSSSFRSHSKYHSRHRTSSSGSSRKSSSRTKSHSTSSERDSHDRKHTWSSQPSSIRGPIFGTPKGVSENQCGTSLEHLGVSRADIIRHEKAKTLLQAYRRGENRLNRHREFELLKLVAVDDNSDDSD